MAPSLPRITRLWSVAILSNRTTERTLSPVTVSGDRDTACSPPLPTLELMKQTITSSPCLVLSETINAGRTFEAVKSVKGKGTSTIVPKSYIALMKVIDAVEIGLFFKETETV